MEYLHSHGVIYRDLKPENLLLSHKGHVIMTDFGLSKEGLYYDERTSTFCGTPEYLAPEIIKGEDYTKAIDWWSVGTLIYEMLTGLPPFYTEDEENMYHKIMTATIDFSKPYFSPEAQDIIKKFLNRDPLQRLQDPREIKSHPWFRDINWDKLMRLELTPPFIPSVKSADDVSNIDEEFLRENVQDEGDDEHQSVPVKKEDFINFTFAADARKAAGLQ
jgi:serine/threonine protein kinase